MLTETDKICIYCDGKISHSRNSKPKHFCNVECRAKGQMSINMMKSKSTENNKELYRKKRRGTTNVMELGAIWNVLRSLDEPRKASWIIQTLQDQYGKKRWLRVNSNGFRKKLNYFNKNLIYIDQRTHAMYYKALKSVPLKEALSPKILEWIQAEYDYNTSDVLKKDN